MNLEAKIKDLGKIAAQTAPKFKKLGVETVQDLLFYFPFRYEDYSNLMKIKDIVPGVMLTVKGKIELIESRRSFRKRMIIIEAIVSDETGQIKVVWFNQRYLSKILSVGDEVYLSGKAAGTETAQEFHNPAFEKVNKYDKFTTHTARIVPIYSSTAKLSQRQIRFLMKRVLSAAAYVKEWLPAEVKKSAALIDLVQALRQVHFPVDKKSLQQARLRLKFDEIFLIQARSRLIKQELLKQQAKKIIFLEKETKLFVESLPFKLTLAQKKAAWEIIKDLGRHTPMNRLLEGDVGSGKTITAAIAILNVLLNKFQVAYMAPTEILAHQQFNSLSEIFNKYNFSIGLLTRSEIKLKTQNTHSTSSGRAINKNQDIKKVELLKMIKNGEVDLVVGTHALIQQKIKFNNLNFVIIDEQHRFGVEQRKSLRQKTGSKDDFPHLLSMTATPIPRYLALTLYGDLELSVIDEMPQDRKPIKTNVVEPSKRVEAYGFIKSQIRDGRQVFVICPLIDPSDKLGVRAVTEEFEKLDKKIFKDVKTGLLHGRLKANEKEKIMKEFLAGEIKILVSTSVVEVGIDVPNASVMMIESAERFGLAQLHQLRGRVGRSYHESYCFLFTESESEMTIKRMQALVSSQNGFELAEKDLEFRGPGEVYGIKQSGYLDNLKIAKLTDWPVIKLVRQELEKIFKLDPKLEKYDKIKNKIREFETSLHFE